MGIRFALDIGVASVGWAVVNDEYVVLESGVNIFPCADASKNMNRRNFRQLKRLHRRRKNRVSDFEKLWQSEKLEIPKNNQINVLQLRVKGLSEKLTQEELFWVLKMNCFIVESLTWMMPWKRGQQMNQIIKKR